MACAHMCCVVHMCLPTLASSMDTTMPADGCVTVSLRTSMTAEEIHRAHVARMQLWPRVASGANRKRIEVRNLACIFAKPCKNWTRSLKPVQQNSYLARLPCTSHNSATVVANCNLWQSKRHCAQRFHRRSWAEGISCDQSIILQLMSNLRRMHIVCVCF